MTKLPKKVQSRIMAGLKKYQKVLEAAKARDINESDTVVIVTDFMSEVLGFDKYSEITTEYSIRGTFCDLAVKIGGAIQYLIEVKAIGAALKEHHLRQAINYAANNGVEWVALTNGVIWQAYRMRFEQPIRYDLVLDLDLLSTSNRDRELVERLFLLSKEGLAKSAIAAYEEERAACSSFIIGAVLQSDPLIAALRRELRRLSPGTRIDADQLRQVLVEEVIKRDVVQSEEAKSAASVVRRASSRTRRLRRSKSDAESGSGVPDEQVTASPAAAESQES